MSSTTVTSHEGMAPGRVRPVAIRECARELGPIEQYLSRVIHPDQDQDHRAGGAVSRSYSAVADVGANGELAGCEQQCGYERAYGDIPPRNLHAWQHLVDGCEQGRDQHEREQRVDPAQYGVD